MSAPPDAFVAFYSKRNRNGFNALAGALESSFGPDCPRIVFAENRPDCLAACGQLIAEGLRVVAGFSFFTSQRDEIAEFAAELRKRFGHELILAAGGPHASALPEDCLRLGFDLAFIGEAEESFAELFARMRAGLPASGIAGTAWPGPDGHLQTGVRRRTVNLDDFSPLPFALRRFGHLEMTRGCPYACRYCQTSHLFGTQVRHRSVETLVHWAGLLRAQGLRDLRLISPNAFSYGSRDGRSVDPAAIEALLAGLRRAFAPPGAVHFGYFPSEVRPEHVSADTLGLLKRYTDTTTIVMGAQSGSPAVLEACRRGHGVEEVLRAARLTISAGLGVIVDFIFGLPGESEADARASLELLHELIAIGARVHPHAFLPLPGTPWANQPAGPLRRSVREALTAAARRRPGAVYGDWGVQVKRGLEISGMSARAGRKTDSGLPG